jgi:hypothetical protein
MGFKSKALPSSEVFRADGQACQCFYPKNQAVVKLESVSHSKPKISKKSDAFNPVGTRSWMV